MSLKEFQQKISTNSKLDENQISNTKGGLRYSTSNTADAFYKYTSLVSRYGASCVCYTFHNGKYCIEW